METYLKIIELIADVYAGKNLTELMSDLNGELESAKIRSIVYGVIRNYFKLDFIINSLVQKIDRQTVILLQVAIYELCFTQKKEYAILNDSVNLAFEITQNNKKKNFTNAVLREFLRNKTELLNLVEQDYSLKYNLPNWMISKLKLQHKANYLEIIEGLSYHPAFGLRLADDGKRVEYLQELAQNEIEYGLYKNKLYLEQPLAINTIPQFNSGGVSVQDIAAQFIPEILQQSQAVFSKVLDACAAPGGKTCQILENYQVELTALELDLKRSQRIQENLQRLGLDANVINADARLRDWWNGVNYDLILADVPCSATGTIKRNPDIKINRRENDLIKFQTQQREIVLNLWDLLADGGYLLYITCSIFNEENSDNIAWFKTKLNNFSLCSELQILPSEYCDSLYYALIQKRAN